MRLLVSVGDPKLEQEIGRILGAQIESQNGFKLIRIPSAQIPGARPEASSWLIMLGSRQLAYYKSRRPERLRIFKSHAKLLIVIDEIDAGNILEAVQLADGLVFRTLNLHRLPTIIGLMQQNYLSLPAELIPVVLHRGLRRELARSLTAAERNTLMLLGRGYSNQRIAATLSLNTGKTKYLVRSLLRKLRLRNRTQAAVFAASEAEDTTSHGSYTNGATKTVPPQAIARH